MHSVASTLILTAAASVYQVAAQSSTSSSGAPASGSSAGGGGVTSLVSGLSSSCQAAAGSLLSSEFGSCANIIGLVSVIGSKGSVVPSLNTWITGICTSNPCSDSTLSTAQSSVNTGCSDDVTKGTASAVSLTTIVGNYKPIRNMLCTQYVSNGTYCVPGILTDIQNASGKNISVMEVQGLLTQGSSALQTMLGNIPSGTYCTDCGKAIFIEAAQIKANGTSTNATAASGSLGSQCGASFVDGNLPTTVRIGSAANSAKNSGVAQVAPQFFTLAALLPIIAYIMV